LEGWYFQYVYEIFAVLLLLCLIVAPSPPENKVVFCTGGAGTICSTQVRALVHLGADACIVGRNVSKTERMAQDIATARPGSKVIGIGAIDVRNLELLKGAAERCAKELGGIDFVMYVTSFYQQSR
jgi:NAD(P)-dependent dehydrogenase (short-subunit alcohol dehydrogenase family)